MRPDPEENYRRMLACLAEAQKITCDCCGRGKIAGCAGLDAEGQMTYKPWCSWCEVSDVYKTDVGSTKGT